MSAVPSYSPTAMWEERDGIIQPAWLKDEDTVEDCIFVKSTGNIKPDLPGSVIEVTRCSEYDAAVGVLYQTSAATSLYAPETTYRRIFKVGRHMRFRMWNGSGVEIPVGSKITVAANGYVKLWDGTNGNDEGYALETIPNNSYGRIWKN